MIELRKNNSGAQRCELYAVEGSGGPGPGRALHPWLAGGFHRHEFCTRIRVFALTPNIRDKSRMREIRQYGSVRGALGDQSPYRDRHLWGSLASCAPMASALFESRKVSDFGNGTVRQK